MDPRLATLLDKQEIEEVVLRYCRGIDRRDFDLVRSCYHVDAVDRHGSFTGTPAEFVAWVDKLTARYRWSMHFIANVLIEPSATNPDLAAAETYGVSLHRSDDDRPAMNLATGFRYVDRFERRLGAFKIAERTAVGEWSIPIPKGAWWEIPSDHVASRRDTGDVIYRLLASLGAAALPD